MEFEKMTKRQLLAFLHRDDIQCFYVTMRYSKSELVFICKREYKNLCRVK